MFWFPSSYPWKIPFSYPPHASNARMKIIDSWALTSCLSVIMYVIVPARRSSRRRRDPPRRGALTSWVAYGGWFTCFINVLSIARVYWCIVVFVTVLSYPNLLTWTWTHKPSLKSELFTSKTDLFQLPLCDPICLNFLTHFMGFKVLCVIIFRCICFDIVSDDA